MYRANTISPPSTPAWSVYAWPLVTCHVHRAPQLHLVHLGTHVLNTDDPDGPCGQTLWGTPSDEAAAGVAWDWVQIQHGVVAIADPFGLVTNLQLVGAQGQVLNPFEVALRLNELVHSLPWQSEVQRALAGIEH